MNPVENKKIEYWKSQLLDTGKRNKMINYRETSRATLKIIEPGLNELYENYVQNELAEHEEFFDNIVVYTNMSYIVING